MTQTGLIPAERIEKTIYSIRGERVMLDRDLAALYGVETKMLKRAVRRNIDRFPRDFMFVLHSTEFQNWRRQFGTSNADRKGLRYPPMAFTEHGILMLSSILNSKRAVYANIEIMRAFVRLRRMLASNAELSQHGATSKRSRTRITTLPANSRSPIESTRGRRIDRAS